MTNENCPCKKKNVNVMGTVKHAGNTMWNQNGNVRLPVKRRNEKFWFLVSGKMQKITCNADWLVI